MKLGKKEITLKFTISACRKLEKYTNTSIFNMSEYFDEMSLDKITILLWIGYSYTNKDFTLDDAGELLDKLQAQGETLVDILQWISDSFTRDINGLLGVKKEEASTEESAEPKN